MARTKTSKTVETEQVSLTAPTTPVVDTQVAAPVVTKVKKTKTPKTEVVTTAPVVDTPVVSTDDVVERFTAILVIIIRQICLLVKF